MACDGDIAPEEIDMVKEFCAEYKLLDITQAESYINLWISEINQLGSEFLQTYLKELSNEELLSEEQKTIVNLSIKTIEADNKTEYSEVKFFKKIRARLSLTDEEILSMYPDKEDFLLPVTTQVGMPYSYYDETIAA